MQLVVHIYRVGYVNMASNILGGTKISRKLQRLAQNRHSKLVKNWPNLWKLHEIFLFPCKISVDILCMDYGLHWKSFAKDKEKNMAAKKMCHVIMLPAREASKMV